ncbi:MAG: adenylyl-sulfate kinase [Thermoplasmata archaeon]
MERAPPGFCVWLTGLPSAGKTTIAKELLPRLVARGWYADLLDGDEIRRGLSADLGFDRKSREAHARRVAFCAKLLARNGAVPVVALISPYRSSRAAAREEVGRFVEVYVSTPLAVCETRDVKGLYRRARAGEIKEMTGIDDPYEVPEHPEITVDTVRLSPAESADFIVAELERLGWVPMAVPASVVGPPGSSLPGEAEPASRGVAAAPFGAVQDRSSSAASSGGSPAR